VTGHDDQAITLTGPEAAFIRQALASCSGMLSVIRLLGGPGRDALADAALQAGDRPLDQVSYDVSLAIDYVDFARPAGSTR
jgi:hypothetical protein